MTMTRYAVVVATDVQNVVVTDDPAFAAAQSWIACPSFVGAGYTFDGTTWTAPPVPGPTTQDTIQANITAHLATIETWLAANPNGAVLTAAQTAVLARMLVGIGRLFLNLTATVGQAS